MSDFDFAQAVVDKVGGIEGLLGSAPAGADTADTVEVIEAREQPRDPETGQFVAKTEEVVDEEEFSETPEEIPEEGDEASTPSEDEDLEEIELDLDHPFFAKYGGDPDKALKAIEEAQSLAGRHSQELAERRQRDDDLSQRLEMLEQRVSRPQVDWNAAIEWAHEQDSPGQALQQVALAALENADEHGLKAAVDAWGEEDPFQASLFVSRLQAEYIASQTQQAPAFAADTVSEGEPKEITAFKERHPDVSKYAEQMDALARERPDLVGALNGSPADQAQALEILYLNARSLADAPDTSAVARKIALRTRAESDEAKKKASVVSSTKSQPASRASGVDEWKRLFRAEAGLPEE